MRRPGQRAEHFVLVHGAANSSGVWRYWQQGLAAHGRASHTVDLRGHGLNPGNLASVSMRDYAADVVDAISSLGGRPVLVGWSMGGLIAMMVGVTRAVSACVCLAPSMPARVSDPGVPLRQGVFGPEEYGIVNGDLENQPAMPDLDIEERAVALASLGKESRLARDERRKGIIVEALNCPLLIATGTEDTQWPRSRYANLWLNADYLEVQGASHWGLVLNRGALQTLIPAVLAWVDSHTKDG